MSFTIKDVASLAGVSVATVSRVLSGKPGIKETTQKKVLQVAKELNYVPNHIARSMITKHTYTIGLVVADITNPFYSDTAKIIEDQARQNGYTVIMCNTNNKPAIQTKIVETLQQKRVDGFIFGSARYEDKTIYDLIQEGFPCVCYHRRIKDELGHFVGCDNAIGTRLILEHLHQLGHHRVAFISGPRDFSTGLERLQGFLSARQEFGFDEASFMIKEGDYDRLKTAKVTRELLKLPDPPTAIFVANDMMALQVMDCILEEGYRIPEDISIAGFDDISIAANQRIQLTTVDSRPEECARLAFEQLLGLINETIPIYESTKILLEPSLKIRHSTARPRSKNLPRLSNQKNSKSL